MGLARRWYGLWLAAGVAGLWSSAASAAEPKVAIGFSNLVARLEGDGAGADEIGFANAEYRVHILEALRAAGLNAVGAESLVFSRDDAEKADVVLGGTVKELACQAVGGQTNCRIGIAWEVLDRSSERVVYGVLTRYLAAGVSTDNHAVTGKRLVLGALASLLKHPHFAQLTGGTSLGAQRLRPLRLRGRCVQDLLHEQLRLPVPGGLHSHALRRVARFGGRSRVHGEFRLQVGVLLQQALR